jgi:hypothetical protein
MIRFATFLLVSLVSVIGLAQEWAVQIKANGAMGMGSLVKVDDKEAQQGWRYAIVATASHVVLNSNNIVIEFENGTKSRNCKVLQRDVQNDLALVWCLAPTELNPVEISENQIEEGDQVSFVGKNKRQFSGRASCLSFDKECWTDVVVMPGDSGGAVLKDKKIVGVISGGMKWTPNPPQRTWPCRSSNLQVLKTLLNNVNSQNSWNKPKKTNQSSRFM